MAEGRQSGLVWKRRRIAPERRERLKAVSRPMSADTPDVWANVNAAAATTAELPDLSAYPTPISKARRLLQAAAAVEHALLVQYLYAGYSLPRGGQRDILNIAIEEMSHLMTVQNLLRLVRGGADLRRQDFGPPAVEAERIFPFNLLLEPLSKSSLAKYIVAESPENTSPIADPALMATIISIATAGAGSSVNRVGTLYALLGVVFGSEAFLLQKAATGDPWYVAVNALAEEAALEYGGRDKIHLEDVDFDAGSLAEQATDAEWDRTVEGAIDEFRVHTFAAREQAVDALRDIGLQGEGPSAVPAEDSHFARFVALFKLYFSPDGSGAGPIPEVIDVPKAARIDIDPASVDPQAISQAETVPWARLANYRYGILLGAIELYLGAPTTDRDFLLSWCFAEMHAMRQLAGVLVTKRRNSSSSVTEMAACPFTLPGWSGRAVTWNDLDDQFQKAIDDEDYILAQPSVSEEERRILSKLRARDVSNHAEATARIGGGASVRRKFDKAREILDWLTGAGIPSHSGSSPQFPTGRQGRFWNQSLNDFKETTVYGERIVEIPPEGGDAPLIRVLRDQYMPRNRSKIQPTDPKFQFLEQWVNDGCPDEPV